MELICLGDSLTFGYGVRRENCWTGLVSKESSHNIINMGLCGDTCAGMLIRLCTQVLSDPRYKQSRPRIMLMGGINDIFYGSGMESAKVNMGTMIQHLLSAGRVPIIGIPMRFKAACFPPQWAEIVDAEKAAGLLAEYCCWLEGYCRAFGIKEIVDFRPPFEGSREELFVDGLHPNERGHRLMADALLEVIGK